MNDAEIPRRSFVERLRGTAHWFAIGISLVVVSIALGVLARHELRINLEREAVRTLGTLGDGETPLRWNLRTPADAIAGRAFGTDDFRFDREGMHMRSNGTPIEVGLVLRGPLDLQRFSLLHVDLRNVIEPELSITLRETLDAEICEGTLHGSARAPTITPDTITPDMITLDLAALAWSCAGEPAVAPSRAAMLRLRLQLPDAATATLGDVALRPRSAQLAAGLVATALPPASDRAALNEAVRTLEEHAESTALPVLTLPFGDARVEQILAARDAIRRVEPTAIVLMADDWPAVVDRARAWTPRRDTRLPPYSAWVGVGLLAVILLGLRLRPPTSPRLRASAELAGVLVVPLVFVLGDGFGDNIDPAWVAAIVATLTFAVSLLFGEAPPLPAARGARRKGWLVAIATLLVALALALALRDPQVTHEWPSATRIARYLAWAAVQQFLICVVVSGLAERALRMPALALLVAASAFALLHSPNAMLMQLTFVGGLIWAWNWQRHRALLPNILAHAASGLVLATLLPPDWLRSAEVGARYFLF